MSYLIVVELYILGDLVDYYKVIIQVVYFGKFQFYKVQGIRDLRVS